MLQAQTGSGSGLTVLVLQMAAIGLVFPLLFSIGVILISLFAGSVATSGDDSSPVHCS